MQLQSATSTADALSLQPPWGYRPMAWLGLLVNLLILPLTFQFILSDPYWRTANITIAAAGVLPTAILGLIASIALLRWQHWGQILAIVALALSLAVCLPYGIVRLVMVDPSCIATSRASFRGDWSEAKRTWTRLPAKAGIGSCHSSITAGFNPV